MKGAKIKYWQREKEGEICLKKGAAKLKFLPGGMNKIGVFGCAEFFRVRGFENTKEKIWIKGKIGWETMENKPFN